MKENDILDIIPVIWLSGIKEEETFKTIENSEVLRD